MDYVADEKTLADYWNVLERRWYILFATAILAMVGTWIWVRRQPPQPFPFITTIELGESIDTNGVAAKMRAEYIPSVLIEEANRDLYKNQRYAVNVEAVEGESIIALRSVGGEEQAAKILSIHQSLVDKLLKDSAQAAASIRNDLERKKFDADLALGVLRDTMTHFPQQERDLDEEERIARRHLVELKALQETYRNNRTQVILLEASRDPESPSLATALLLIDATIEANGEKVQVLEQRLAGGFPQERRSIAERRSSVQRDIAGLERDVDDIQSRIDTIKYTQVLIPPSRFLRVDRSFVFRGVAIAAFAGLFVGGVIAFFLEFIRNARKLRTH
ncbi:MAG: hypothetical protein Q7T01_03600 [bacterium]|nr:hypothetical protein [bacterium]